MLETTVKQMSHYIKKQLPNSNLPVEEIQKHEENKSKNEFFKVDIDLHLISELMKPNVWPEDR